MLGGHRMCRAVKAAASFPASLPFTTWLLDYSATPWEGEDSAGTSGARDLVAPSGATYPSAGPTLNGHATGTFNGTTMAGQFGATAATLDEVLGNDDYSFGVVAYVPTPPTDSGLYYSNRAIFATADIYYAQLYVRSSGLAVWSNSIDAVSASGVKWNAWNFFQVRRVGSTAYIRVNGGSWSSATFNDFANVAKAVRLGITSGGAYLQMDLAQFWTAKEAVSTDNFDLLLAYVRTLYGLPGDPPTITSLNYNQGDTAGGGQSIVITGTNLTGATSVTFLGTAATSYTVDSATQITAVLPAHAAGTGNVQVTTPALGGVATIAFEYWGTSAAAEHWKADYAGSPWAGTYMSGEDLSEATNAPSVGTEVNGFAPADFDGTNDKLTSTSAASAFMSTSAYTGWALVRVRSASSAATDYTDIYSRDGIVGSSSNAQDWGVGVRSDSTVGVYHYGGGSFDGVTTGITLDAWQLVQWKYDGTNLKIRVNGGAWASIAKGAVSSLAQTVLVGESQVAGTEYADMLLMDLGLDSAAWSDAELDKLRKYAQQRYGLSV